LPFLDVNVEWVGLEGPELNKEKTLFGYNKPLNPEEEVSKHYQSPKNIPPIFDGNQMVIFGLFPPSIKKKPKAVKITADTPDGPLTLELPVTSNFDVGTTKMLHNLAAIKLVREMELDESAGTPSLKDDIVTIATENGKFNSDIGKIQLFFDILSIIIII
jgi:hypothetical protein